MIPSENTAKIISTLEHLFPNTREELIVIKSGRLEIVEAEDFQTFLEFFLSSGNLNFPVSRIPHVEETLKSKIEIIFRWFPVYKISSVKITVVKE